MKQVQPLNGINDEHIIVEMTIQEYLEYKQLKSDKKFKVNVGKGLSDLMEMFKCSKATAFKIAHSDWFEPALIFRQGKLMNFDKDLALELAKEHSKLKL